MTSSLRKAVLTAVAAGFTSLCYGAVAASEPVATGWWIVATGISIVADAIFIGAGWSDAL